MALLIVPRESWTHPSSSSQPPQTSPVPATSDFGALSELVDPSLRRKVAKDVNEAILQSQGERREANIRYLVRARAWAEHLAREKKVELPQILNLGLDGEDEVDAQTRSQTQGNGHAAAPAPGEVEMADDADDDDDVPEGRRRGAGAAGDGLR